MLATFATHRMERNLHPLTGLSRRPALTHLAILTAVDPRIAERLLRGEAIETAIRHPHYNIVLDERDRADIAAIRERAKTVEEFLAGLASIVDGERRAEA
jgi:hypothetical protein